MSSLSLTNAVSQEYRDSLRHNDQKSDFYHCHPPNAIDTKYCMREDHKVNYSRIAIRQFGLDGSDTIEDYIKYEIGLARPLRIPLVTHTHTVSIDIVRFSSEMESQLGVFMGSINRAHSFNLPSDRRNIELRYTTS